jgi:hypothetical protein
VFKVHVKESVFTVSCGDGGQTIRWLAEVALLKYDPNYMMMTGEPKGVRGDNNTVLNMNEIIKNILQEGSHIWVLVGEEALNDGSQKKKEDPKKK